MADSTAKYETDTTVASTQGSLPDYDAVLKLLDEWLADESGYDERVWPDIEKGLRENPLLLGSRFDK